MELNKNKMNNEIDFVILWVDGSDRAWREEKKKYSPQKDEDIREERYRDWDNLQYWFRGVEKFAPWVRKIHFVTWGHIPSWLNIAHPKINIVKHEDFIPKQYLPTFSSHPIELNLHRIHGLSEHFVYFNDDMFLLKPVKQTDFFRKGLPCDSAVLNAISFGRIQNSNNLLFMMPAYNMAVINAHFDRNKTIKERPLNWFNLKYGIDLLRTLCLLPWHHFTGFVNYHLPYSYNKKTLEEVWEKEKEVLNETSLHKFRQHSDVNTWLFSYWQFASNQFMPRRPKCGIEIGLTDDDSLNKRICNMIEKQQYKMICINDNVSIDSFIRIKQDINSSFEKILPNKSQFEK